MAKSSAVVLMALAAVLWSAGGILIKWVDMGPLAIAGWRSLISGVTIWLLMGRPKLRLQMANLILAAAYCCLVICFVVSTKWTTSANAIMLQYTSPVFVAILAPRLLNEPTRWYDWLTIAVGLPGLSLFFLDELSPQGLWGNLVAIGSAVSLAAVFMLLRKQKDAQPLQGVIMGNFLTALVCIPFMAQSIPSAQGWLGLVLMGVFQLGLGYYLFTRAISYIPAVESALICIAEPVLNPVWVFIFLGETPQTFALIGGALVLGAAACRGVLAARTTDSTN
jgi:drug/metabolite transporter (DMT)-like permease